MDNKIKLIAPKPVRMNPFTSNKIQNNTLKEKRLCYSNSDKLRSKFIYYKNCTLNDNSFDLNELEKDFNEIEARSEIFSILYREESTFFNRNSIIINSCLISDDPIKNLPFISHIPIISDSKDNIRT